MSATAAPAPSESNARRLALPLGRVDAGVAIAVVLAVGLTWIAIHGNGGLGLGDATTVEIVVDLVAGAAVAVAALSVPRLRQAPGALAAALFAVFVLASLVSTVWSVDPSQSWIEINRLVAYLGAFFVGISLVRLAPGRWAAVLTGVTLACVVVSAVALFHKTFPEPLTYYARLNEPFGYWNAVGLMAALGIPGCLWLGARRAGHAALNAFAYPAAALLLVVLMLAYSRGALLALLLGCAFWFAVVPLRLRGAAVLASAVAGAAVVVGWAFSQPALSDDGVPLAQRESAGHQLLVAVLFMMLALLLAGLAIGFASARWPLRAQGRRRLATALVAALALVPAAGAAGLATSQRGFGGSISHAWHELTSTNAALPANDPGRLTAVGSVRALYWSEALKIFRDHPILGVGNGGYATARRRYRKDVNVKVEHAHGYVVQVLADRGVVGLVLSLAALVAVLVAVARATGLRRPRSRAPAPAVTPERVALLTMTSAIVVFGVHSFVDWTWFIPGVTMPVLVLGGWLTARGRLAEAPPAGPDPARLRNWRPSAPRALAAALAVALALASAWAAWQPQRSEVASDDALAALDAGHIGDARRLAVAAHDRDPLSVHPYFVRAAVEQRAGDRRAALRALQRAVRLQPANPDTWSTLAAFQVDVLREPAAARRSIAAALYLDPRSPVAFDVLLRANRSLAEARTARPVG